MANALRVAGPDFVEGIREFCQRKVRQILRKRHRLEGIGDLQAAICEELNLTVHEVWSDGQLSEVVGRYVTDGDTVFAYVPSDLKPATTFGVLVRRDEKDKQGRLRWAALVDCRGDKHLRRFFTLWHEIAHCLTAVEQFELPLYRRTSIHASSKDSVETVTDLVASDFAFYDAIFNPILEDEINRSGRLTFEGVDRVRAAYCPEASFQSTILACVRQTSTATLLVQAEMGYKKAELAALSSGQQELLPGSAPKSALRVTDSFRNESARARRLHIPKKMRVPESSVISTAYFNGSLERPKKT